MRKIILLIVLIAMAWQGMKHIRPGADESASTQAIVAPRLESAPIPSMRPIASQTFACDGRTHCSQMKSCEEATYFLQHCPGVKMDGNHDGIPCEQQWCRSTGNAP